MRTAALTALAVALVAAATVAVLVRGAEPQAASASSHREAPLIAEDPSADATDLYAFRSPDRPDTVTIIGNWIPAEDPAAGPNWYTFSPRARYLLHIDRTGDGKPEVSYRFRFRTKDPVAFLGNTAQTYSITRIANGRANDRVRELERVGAMQDAERRQQVPRLGRLVRGDAGDRGGLRKDGVVPQHRDGPHERRRLRWLPG